MTKIVAINTRLKEWDRTKLTNTVNNMLLRRKKLVHCPWREDPHKFYSSLIPVEVRDAMMAIANGYSGKFSGLLNTYDCAHAKVKTDSGEFIIEFGFGKQMPCIDGGWRGENALEIKGGHPGYDPLVDFALECRKCNLENKDINSLVEHVATTCNTYGQIFRVWPELLHVADVAKMAAAENQQRRSSLPYDLNVDMIMKHRDDFTHKLAVSSLLDPSVLNDVNTWLA